MYVKYATALKPDLASVLGADGRGRLAWRSTVSPFVTISTNNKTASTASESATGMRIVMLQT